MHKDTSPYAPLTAKSYTHSFVKAAPAEGIAAIAKSLQGGVDKYVESWLKGNRVSLGEAMAGRGIGRGMGGLAPRLIMAPLFYHQMAKIKQQRRATPADIAKLTAIGAAASGAKGLLESTIEGTGIPGAAKALMASRAMSGGLSAAYLASRIATNLVHKRDTTTKGRLVHEVLKPALYGTLAGAGKGAWDKIVFNLIKHHPIPEDVIPAVGGRAAAGALGGLILEQIGKWMLGKHKKQ